MNKFIWILPALALSTIAIDSLPVLSKPAANPNNQPRRSQPKQSPFSWLKIFAPLSNPQPPVKAQTGVSRGRICMFSPDSPDGTIRVVWNTQPLFLWKVSEGAVITKMKLHPENDRNNNLWNQAFKGQNSAIYQGSPLQPGKIYHWVIDGMFVPFQIMEEGQRNKITQELKALENQYQAQGATPEEIASAKANYFVERNLWSDALQQAYVVENPSPELVKIRQEIRQKLCNI
ncbi:DUF928 domain-containing protein [Nostoc linckia FACHB-104]|nr:DUF928 domain-containing protein [Nostoc linckia FACHB-104]